METARFNFATFGWKSRSDALAAMQALPDAPLLVAGMGVPFVVVQDFTAAQQVLVADVDSYAKPGFIRRIMISGLGHNLFSAQGDEWIEQRRPVAPVFAATEMNSLATIMGTAVEQQASDWKTGTLDIQNEMAQLALNVACQALLGVDPKLDDLGRTIRDNFEIVLTWLAAHLQNPGLPPASVPTPGNRAMKAAKTNLQDAVRQLIAARRDGAANGSAYGDDVLGRLISNQRDTGTPSDSAIIDECIGFLFAGHETTASTLTWALYELATHANIQAEVAVEGASLDLSSATLHDDAAALEATDRVVEETLRLYPSGIAIARVAKKATELGGHRLRKGTMVMIAAYRIQRQPEVWERPNEFDPDRPTPPTESGLRNSFLAFGLGPRRCLGARFARTEMRIALATICSRWQLSYEQPAPPVPEVSPSLRAAGTLPLMIEDREIFR